MMKVIEKNDVRRFTFYAFIIILPIFSFRILVPIIPDLMRAIHMSKFAVQFSFALYFFCYAFMQLLYGLMADKFGHKLVIMVAIFIFLIGCLLSAVATNEVVFILSRVIQSAGVSATTILILAAGARLFKEKKLAILTKFLDAFRAILSMFIPFLGVYIVYQFGWPYIFIFMAFLAIVALIIVFLYIDNTKKEVSFKAALTFYTDFLLQWRVILLIIPLSLMYSLMIVFSISTPIIFYQNFHVSSFEYAIIAMITVFSYSLGAIFSILLVWLLGRKISVLTAVLLGALAAVALLFISLYSANLYLAVIPFIVVYFANGLLIPALITRVLKFNDASNPTVSGIVGFVQMIIMSFVLMLVSFRFMDSLLLIAVLYLAAAIISLLLLMIAVRNI